MDEFHAWSERGVRQETYAHFALIAATRSLAKEGDDLLVQMREKGKPRQTVNFKNALALVAANLEELLLAGAVFAAEAAARAAEWILRARSRRRPGRSYPRVSKNRRANGRRGAAKNPKSQRPARRSPPDDRPAGDSTNPAPKHGADAPDSDNSPLQAADAGRRSGILQPDAGRRRKSRPARLKLQKSPTKKARIDRMRELKTEIRLVDSLWQCHWPAGRPRRCRAKASASIPARSGPSRAAPSRRMKASSSPKSGERMERTRQRSFSGAGIALASFEARIQQTRLMSKRKRVWAALPVAGRFRLEEAEKRGGQVRHAGIAAPARAGLVDLVDKDHRIGGPGPDDRVERNSRRAGAPAPFDMSIHGI